jgi:hypothetical protein
LNFVPPWRSGGGFWPQALFWAIVAALVALLAQAHRLSRRWATRAIAAKIAADPNLGPHAGEVEKAFRKNSGSWWRPYFRVTPRGWGPRARKRVDRILTEADRAIQALNDRYAHPSGGGAAAEKKISPDPAAAPTSSEQARA